MDISPTVPVYLFHPPFPPPSLAEFPPPPVASYGTLPGISPPSASSIRPFPVWISPSYFPEICISFLFFGFLVTCVLFIYELSLTKFERRLSREFFLASLASLFLGIGTTFLFLWCGIYL
eukprot:GHVS01045843.1.p1 GENE.GHVS01045843.1~~GHVS01045843.1.p1  ORF type:complete len:120 (+),score=26.20 GHVS01045843.1:265-624(+)